jgi:hypothetical protein
MLNEGIIFSNRIKTYIWGPNDLNDHWILKLCATFSQHVPHEFWPGNDGFLVHFSPNEDQLLPDNPRISTGCAVEKPMLFPEQRGHI